MSFYVNGQFTLKNAHVWLKLVRGDRFVKIRNFSYDIIKIKNIGIYKFV